MKKNQISKKEDVAKNPKDFVNGITKMYSFNSASVDWMPTKGELLEIAGTGDKTIGNVVFVELIKNPDGSMCNHFHYAYLAWMGDYDEKTMTYKVKYSFPEDPDKLREERIIPEGFSINIADIVHPSSTINKFVPFSLFYKVTEKEAFYKKVTSLWESRKTLPFSELKKLDNKKSVLNYSRNIVAAFKRIDEDNKVVNFCFKIHDLKLTHDNKSIWRLIISDENNFAHTLLIDSEDTESSFYKYSVREQYIGDLKIIDLMDI